MERRGSGRSTACARCRSSRTSPTTSWPGSPSTRTRCRLGAGGDDSAPGGPARRLLRRHGGRDGVDAQGRPGGRLRRDARGRLHLRRAHNGPRRPLSHHRPRRDRRAACSSSTSPSFWEMLRICPEVLRGILATSVERAELHESVSQQHGKLISLGTMAAGLAHELNNPAAAIGRSATEAREAFREASERAVELGGLPLSDEQRRFVAGLPEEVARRSANAGSARLAREERPGGRARDLDGGPRRRGRVGSLRHPRRRRARRGLARRTRGARARRGAWLACSPGCGRRWPAMSCCGRSRAGRPASPSSSGRSRPTRTWTRPPPRRSTCTRG